MERGSTARNEKETKLKELKDAVSPCGSTGRMKDAMADLLNQEAMKLRQSLDNQPGSTFGPTESATGSDHPRGSHDGGSRLIVNLCTIMYLFSYLFFLSSLKFKTNSM